MMGIFLVYVGFVFFSVLYVQQGLSSQAKFTEFPRNVTATEGQNVEMSCAFQSGSASVYLEIQWWFLRGPEDLEPGAEGAGAQVELLPDRDPDSDGTKISVSAGARQGPRAQARDAQPFPVPEKAAGQRCRTVGQPDSRVPLACLIRYIQMEAHLESLNKITYFSHVNV